MNEYTSRLEDLVKSLFDFQTKFLENDLFEAGMAFQEFKESICKFRDDFTEEFSNVSDSPALLSINCMELSIKNQGLEREIESLKNIIKHNIISGYKKSEESCNKE